MLLGAIYTLHLRAPAASCNLHDLRLLHLEAGSPAPQGPLLSRC